MKLYTYFRSSAAYRVRIALNLKGIAAEQVAINLLKKEHRNEAFLAINPQGRVPALDLGGALITQSLAILEYLEETHPEPALLPADPVARAKVRAVADVIACDVHPLNNSGTLAYLKQVLGHEQPVIDQWYAHWIREGFFAVERVIEPGPYCFGETPTFADCCLAPQLFNAHRFGVPLDAFPKIAEVERAYSRNEAFQKAAPEAQSDAA